MRPRPKPPADLDDLSALEEYEWDLRAWERDCEEEKRLLAEEQALLSKRVATPEDFAPAMDSLAARLDRLEDREPMPGPRGLPGPPGAGTALNLDDILLTNDGLMIFDEQGNIVLKGI